MIDWSADVCSSDLEIRELLPRLRRLAIGLAGHPADGDDLCQMTIERALTRKDQFQDGTRLDSWMYRIMRNIWIDESRARTRRLQTFTVEEAGLVVGADGSQEAVVALGDIDSATGDRQSQRLSSRD